MDDNQAKETFPFADRFPDCNSIFPAHIRSEKLYRNPKAEPFLLGAPEMLTGSFANNHTTKM